MMKIVRTSTEVKNLLSELTKEMNHPANQWTSIQERNEVAIMVLKYRKTVHMDWMLQYLRTEPKPEIFQKKLTLAGKKAAIDTILWLCNRF